jgi:hypothetical protein
MQIKFNTQGTLDFADYWYILAVNTGQVPSQSGEPYVMYANQAPGYWKNLDYAIEVYAEAGGQPAATMYPFVVNAGGGPTPIKVIGPKILPTSGAIVLNPNCNGLGTQFCVTFDRSLLHGSSTWYVNWWVTLPGIGGAPGAPVNAAGPSGVSDQLFAFTVDTTATASCTAVTVGGAGCLWNAPGWVSALPGAAQIAGGQIINAPGSP